VIIRSPSTTAGASGAPPSSSAVTTRGLAIAIAVAIGPAP
jgi:hypothetical protein